MTRRVFGSVRPRSLAILGTAVALVAGLLLTAVAPRPADRAYVEPTAETAPPRVIRIGGPGAAKENQKMWGLLEIARTQGFFDRAFAGENVRFEYIGFTTVPMVGEALASGAVDFAGQGELIAILARSTGTDTRMIMPVSRLENAYLMVPVNSPIRRVEDIRGKRIAYMRGAYIHIQTLRILSDHGMTEEDIQPVNLDPASAATLMASGGIDGVFVGSNLAYPMRNRGIARIAYDTQNAPTQTAQTGLIVRAEFAERYPRTTERVVEAMVAAAEWAADPANREATLSLWVYGTEQNPADYREDIGAGPLTRRASPLIDPFVLSQYRNTQAFALQANLLTTPIDLDEWIDTRYLDRALARRTTASPWPVRNARGQLTDPPILSAQAAPLVGPAPAQTEGAAR